MPLPLIRLVIWPAAAALSAYQLLYRGPTLRRFRELPLSLRPDEGRLRWLWRLWAGRTALITNKLVRFVPDRLREPRWQARCRLHGVERLDSVLAAGRPAILATLHYGNLDELCDWLRARGVTAAILSAIDVDRVSDYRNHVEAIRDNAYGMTGDPGSFQTDRLWDVRDFLFRPGRVLVVAVDAVSKNQVLVRGEGYRLRISPGSLRLAAIVNAGVIPCLTRSPRGLATTVVFGDQVPDEEVNDRRLHAAACEHIVREVLSVLVSFPEQCDPYFLHYCLDTAAEAGA